MRARTLSGFISWVQGRILAPGSLGSCRPRASSTRWYPMLRPLPDARLEDLAACKALLRKGSRSFAAASLLLPKRVREPAAALYAFCRVADDAIDLSADPGAVA